MLRRSSKRSPAKDSNRTLHTSKRRDWQHILTELGGQWSKLDLQRFWWLSQSDLARRIKNIQDTTTSDTLFSIEEQKDKRFELSAFLENNFFARLKQSLHPGFWGQVGGFFRSSRYLNKNSIDHWQQRYRDAGKLAEFDHYHEIYQHKQAKIRQSSASYLYDSNERGARLHPHIQSTRRAFRKIQQRQLRRHTKFSKLIDSLPEDELDVQLSRLAEEFSLIGRTREWFRELEKLIDEVFDGIENRDYGQNESVVRLLQNDFLLTMQGRFSTYWRYFELREHCFDNSRVELINRISYFENQRIDMLASSVSFHDCDVHLRKFTHELAASLASESRRKQSRNNKRDRILAVDHTNRLQEWEEYKQAYTPEDASVINIFNHLKPILEHCPDWLQEFSVFRSMVKVKRFTNRNRQNSSQELNDARLFVKRMTQRVENEIATDVAFQLLEQELIRDKQFLPELNQVLKQIGLERETRSHLSANAINEAKNDFIHKVRQKRAPKEAEQEVPKEVEPRAKVVSLFARSRITSRR